MVLFEDTSRLTITYDLTQHCSVLAVATHRARGGLRCRAEERINQLLPRIERYMTWAPAAETVTMSGFPPCCSRRPGTSHAVGSSAY
jgi:hypothetical protein